MMNVDQMIYIIKNGLVHTLQTKYRKQVMEFAFGEEYMNQPDDMKGTLQTYEEKADGNNKGTEKKITEWNE